MRNDGDEEVGKVWFGCNTLYSYYLNFDSLEASYSMSRVRYQEMIFDVNMGYNMQSDRAEVTFLIAFPNILLYRA